MRRKRVLTFLVLISSICLASSQDGPCGGEGEQKDWISSDDFCYRIKYEKVTWHKAKEECKNLNSSLASINTKEENEFLKNELSEHPPQTSNMWIGVNALGPDGVFAWDDGSPLVVDEWTQKALNNTDITNKCGSMRINDGLWELENCNTERHGFICKIRRPGLSTELPVTTAPTITGSCPVDWTEYGNRCYRFFGKDAPLSWNEARSFCNSEAGHLASSHSEMDQMLIIRLVDEAGTSAWIGLKKSYPFDQFFWEDQSETDFTAWNTGMHKPTINEICVEAMNKLLRAGKWNQLSCTDKKPFICQKPKDKNLPTPPPTESGNCGKNFFEYKDDCYTAVTDDSGKLSWAEAEKSCSSLVPQTETNKTGHLVSVTDAFQQAFLAITFPSTLPLWIGLSSQDLLLYEWVDKWPVTLTYWDKDQPIMTRGHWCTTIDNGGRWSASNCKVTKGYICRITSKSPPEVPKVQGACPSKEWIDIGTSTCYFITTKPKLSWDGASDKCKRMDPTGRLASIHSLIETQMIGEKIELDSHVWIGLRRTSSSKGSSYLWSDKTPSDFWNWNDGEPSRDSGEDCVEAYSHDLKWNNAQCYSSNGYVCAADKSIPGLCGGDGIHEEWLALAGFCYTIESYPRLSWHEAKKKCAEMDSTLASFRLREENDFVFTMLEDSGIKGNVWIGLNALGADGAFGWDDGTILSLDEWSTDALKDNTNRKKCAVMNVKDGTWGVDSCTKSTNGFICKTRQPGFPTVAPPTQPPFLPGFCPAGWIEQGNKCYKLFGKDQPLSWYDARATCREMNDKSGHLASIHSELEQMALTMLIGESEVNAWIGLERNGFESNYVWEDESATDFQAWNVGMHTPSNYDLCAEMMNKLLRPGKWNILQCKNERPYICQMSKDTALWTRAPVVRNNCDDQRFLEYKGDCYALEGDSATRRSWSEAEKYCSTLAPAGSGKTSHLVSILNHFEQAFMAYSFADPEPLWIGYSDQLDRFSKTFGWTDEWPTTFTNWDNGQPMLTDSGTQCSTMSQGGRWSVSDCNKAYGFVCKITSKTPPKVERVTGTCPSDKWIDVGTSKCYFLSSDRNYDWNEASEECEKLANRSTLASFHSKLEMSLLIPHLRELPGHLWIGLSKNDVKTGSFKWSDESPVGFFNWAQGEPGTSSGEQCVEMYGFDMTWNDVSCYSVNGYLCTADKEVTVPSTCGEGMHKDWKVNDGYCYYAEPESRLTWHQAKKRCSELDSNLVSFRNTKEMDYVFMMLKNLPPENYKQWIGLSALGADGAFFWDDGTPFTVEAWNENTASENPDRKKCAFFYANDATWGVDSCISAKYGFVCKARQPGWPTDPPPPITPSLPGFCPQGWSTLGNKCYKLFGKDEKVTWREAQKKCQEQDSKTGHLASVHTEMEQMLLTNVVDLSGTNAWIGLHKVYEYPEYSWDDQSVTDYVAWNLGFHNPQLHELCVEMMTTTLRPGKWNPLSCTDKRPFICQISKDANLKTEAPPIISSKCGQRFVEYKDDCYQTSKEKKSFADAEKACQALEPESGRGKRAHLVSITDPFQQAFVAVNFRSEEPLWIGFGDHVHQESNEFDWTDTWGITYTNWETGQPDVKTTSSRCASMLYGGRWRVAECNQAMNYICRITTKIPPPIVTIDGICPSDEWVDTRLSTCYFIYPEARKDWDEAFEECQMKAPSGRLASFHNDLELQLLIPFISELPTNLWIGLKKDSNGIWKWSDGTPEGYFKWAKNEPSQGYNENCVELHSYDITWNDDQCYKNKGYICAADKTPNQDRTETTTAAVDDKVCGGSGVRNDWPSLDGFCYYVERNLMANWHWAKEQCATKGSKLLSLSHREEMDFLVEMINFKPLDVSRLWIGLNALGADGVFAWDDGTPLTLEEWRDDPDETNINRDKCVYMNAEDGSWQLDNCNTTQYGYVCKAAKPGWPTQPPPPVTPTLQGFCPQNWINYGNKCYQVFGKDELMTWDDAKGFCRSQDEKTGHLASVHSEMEQLFLTTVIDASGVNAWIGLRIDVNREEFYWEDNSEVVFTAWNKGMHQPNHADRCVEMLNLKMRPGKWNELNCKDKRPFICAMSKDSSLTTPSPPVKSKCGPNYLEYKDDCYIAMTKRVIWKSWKAAETSCSALNAGPGMSSHLVSVQDAFQMAFLAVTFASQEPLWIGYSDKVDEGGKTFQWTDNWPTTFTNWNSGHPDNSPKETQCVTMTYEGKWSVNDCDEPKGFICRATSKSPPPVVKVDGACPSSDWVDIQTSKCYFIRATARITWESSATECEKSAPNATLASFHSEHELQMLSPHLQDLESHMWIGLRNDTKTGVFQWIDGSATEFSNWNEGEPSNAYDENCVELYAHNLKWNDIRCNDFKVPATTTTEAVTEYTSCEPDLKGWTFFQDYCYLMQELKEGATDWFNSEDFCNDMGAHLVSIHGSAEEDFIFKLMENKKTVIPIWTGLSAFRTDYGFKWTDQSPVDYPKIDHPTPEQGRCVALDPESKSWTLQQCSRKNGLICKHPRGETSYTRTTPATTRAPGHCHTGWLRAGNKCFFLDEDNLNWAAAQEKCRGKGDSFDIASIHSLYEQATVTSLLSTNFTGVWIGLKLLLTKDMGTFGWSDNSRVDFENWAPMQPSSKDQCVEMMVTKTRAGRWNDESCSETRPFVCQQILGSGDEGPTTPTDSTDSAMTLYRGSFFQSFTLEPVTWGDAEKKCISLGGHLASVESIFEQSFLHTLVQEDTAQGEGHWIGLSYTKDGLFQWSDNWPVYYTSWDAEKSGDPSPNSCVFLNPENKQWSVADCNEKKDFVCKFTNKTAPAQPLAAGKVCPSGPTKWMDVGLEYCYWVEQRNSTETAMTWGEARADCHNRGSELASFHVKHEIDVLIPTLSDSHFDLWIGLTRKQFGGHEWSDSSSMNFWDWDKKHPKNGRYDDCVSMSPVTQKWADRSCSNKLGHICKILKVEGEQQNDGGGVNRSAVAAVGAVLGILCLVIVVALLIKRRLDGKGLPLSFDNILYRGRRSSDQQELA